MRVCQLNHVGIQYEFIARTINTAMPQKIFADVADVTIDDTSDISAELFHSMKEESEMFATKTKSTLTIVVSLMAGALLLAGTGLAAAKDSKSKLSRDPQPKLVEGARSSFGKDSKQNDREGKHKHKDKDKDKDRDGKHNKNKDKDKGKDKDKDKDKNKCGHKKKCPTPKPITIIQGGNPPTNSGTNPGHPGTPVLSDPGYSGPSSSGGGGAGSPGGNPIQNGGSTIKPN